MFRVLIVEENTSFRHSLKALLRSRFPFFDLEEVADGEEALQTVAARRPDVIFMDIRLSGQDGL